MSDLAARLPRLFTAIVWDEDQAAPLLALQRTLREIHAALPLCWSADADLHATLRFHGDTTPTYAARLRDELRDTAAQTRLSRMQFETIETWPSTQPTVLVARLRASASLRALQAQIEAQARVAGAAPETRAFVPHVTLARAASGARWEAGLARVKLAPFSLPVDTIALWHSDLRAAGLRYAELVRCTFGRPSSLP